MSESWVDQLKVNDLFDVRDAAYKTWLIARVLEINETKIKLHFCGWNQRFDEWKKKDNFLDPNKVAPLNTHTFPSQYCQFQYDEFPNKCYYYLATDISTKSIFYDHRGSSTFLTKFNPITNKASPLGEMEYAVQSNSLKAFDGENLYFIPNLNKIISNILSFNTASAKWDKMHFQSPIMLQDGQTLDSFIFSADDNKFQLFLFHPDKGIEHMVYERKGNIFIHIKQQSFDSKQDEKLTKHTDYGKSCNLINGTKLVKILRVVGDSDYPYQKKAILFDLDTGLTKNLGWFMPIDKVDAKYSNKMQSMVVYGDILIVFALECTWFYDYKLDEWFMENKSLPMPLALLNCIDFKDDYLHCMMNMAGTISENFVENNVYIKVFLWDIMPKGLIQARWEQFDKKLVDGFVNGHINEYNIAEKYPLCVNEIIASYYPAFLHQ